MTDASLLLASVLVEGEVIVAGNAGDGHWRDLGAHMGRCELRELLDGEALVEAVRDLRGRPKIDARLLTFLPPVSSRSKIFCVGFNYPSPDRSRPDHPTLFLRLPDSLTGHDAPIVNPSVSSSLDWEGELAIVIGKQGRHIAVEESDAHIAGYSCFADNTVREFARHGTQATAGKNFEASGAIGPAIRLRAGSPPRNEFELVTRVNEKQVQRVSTGAMYFSPAELISYISAFTTLYPGDVIATGTPAGIGARMSPPTYLRPGDILEVAIDGVGVLRNHVVDESNGSGS